MLGASVSRSAQVEKGFDFGKVTRSFGAVSDNGQKNGSFFCLFDLNCGSGRIPRILISPVISIPEIYTSNSGMKCNNAATSFSGRRF